MYLRKVLFLITVVLLVTCVPALAANYTDWTQPYDADTYTILLAHFDEGTGTTIADSGPNNITGNMSPDLAADVADAWVDGQAGFGKAVRFDLTPENNKYITFDENPALGVGIDTDLTMEAWINRQYQGNWSQVIAINRTGGDYYWEFDGSGHMSFQWYSDGWRNVTDYSTVWGTGEWIHAAVTTNRSAPVSERYIKFWMNGVEVFSVNPTNYEPSPVAGPLHVGASGDIYSYGRMLRGTIDELRISSTIRFPAQPIPEPGTMATLLVGGAAVLASVVRRRR